MSDKLIRFPHGRAKLPFGYLCVEVGGEPVVYSDGMPTELFQRIGTCQVKGLFV